MNITNLKIRYKEKGGIGFCIHLRSLVYQNCSASWAPVDVAYGDHDDSIYKSLSSLKIFPLSFNDKHSSTDHNNAHSKERNNNAEDAVFAEER